MADLPALVVEALDGQGTGPFGWRLHRNVETDAHLLLTCEPDAMWRAMPGQAVRSAIVQHLTHWAGVLGEAGLGAVPWGPGKQPEVLVVAETQEAAEREAPAVAAYLSRAAGDG